MILLYEDDEDLAGAILKAFGSAGVAIARLASEAAVSEAAHAQTTRVLIMDRMVHQIDSLQILERIRREGSRTPVIIISSMATVDDRIRGLSVGGDDYLIKPFAMGELVARVEALLRRGSDVRETQLAVGDLTMDLIERSVRRGDREVALLPREFTLLEFFMRRADQVVTRSMLLEGVWKFKATLTTNVVDVHISHLRRKIDAKGERPLLRNKRGVGFILTAEESGDPSTAPDD